MEPRSSSYGQFYSADGLEQIEQNSQGDAVIEKLEERIGLIEQILREQGSLSAGAIYAQ